MIITIKSAECIATLAKKNRFRRNRIRIADVGLKRDKDNENNSHVAISQDQAIHSYDWGTILRLTRADEYDKCVTDLIQAAASVEQLAKSMRGDCSADGAMRVLAHRRTPKHHLHGVGFEYLGHGFLFASS